MARTVPGASEAPAAPELPVTPAAPVTSAVRLGRAATAGSAAPEAPAASATSAAPAGRPAWAVPDATDDSAAPAAPVTSAVRLGRAATAGSAAPEAPAASATPAAPAAPRVSPGESAPTFVLRALPEPAGSAAPGTVAPPTGVFGPPPRMDAAPAGGGVAGGEAAPGASAPGASAPGVPAAPVAIPGGSEGAAPEPASVPARRPAPVPALVMDPDPAPKPTPTPARGFDAVAEAVLGDAPLTAPGDATTPALLAEPTARINEAVREGRTQDAARLAERSVAEASDTLGPEHPEVLRLRELTAYIAYLSGDPGRAFRLSLDLARIHRAAGDPEAAYGNVQSAATAWRAVRDPEQGLELGHDLVALWSELAVEAGPAADDAEQLESARTRMGRLTERARAHARAD
ncbi:tetratricopeptide repeat protein [Streptomyces flaveolus]